MRLLQFTTVKLTLCLICGILIGYYLRPSLPISFSLTVASLILLGVVFVYYRKLPTFLFALFTGLLTIAIGIFSIALSESHNLGQHYSQQNLNINRGYTLKIREVLKANGFSDRYVAHVKSMDSLKVSGKILLNIATDSSI
ncbi:MAG: ComEC family competence protein, partial [Arenibacter sp.]